MRQLVEEEVNTNKLCNNDDDTAVNPRRSLERCLSMPLVSSAQLAWKSFAAAL